jgi:hypothetical protein
LAWCLYVLCLVRVDRVLLFDVIKYYCCHVCCQYRSVQIDKISLVQFSSSRRQGPPTPGTDLPLY